jgi:hypothetical protein
MRSQLRKVDIFYAICALALSFAYRIIYCGGIAMVWEFVHDMRCDRMSRGSIAIWKL